MSKRFPLFAGDKWYPVGGGLDYVSEHDTLDEAIECRPPPADVGSQGYGCQWMHVFDLDTKTVVMAWEATYGPPDESTWEEIPNGEQSWR